MKRVINRIAFAKFTTTALVMFVFIMMACFSCGKVTFNMSGASFGEARTCQVNFFENRADIVNPRLSSQVTDALKDKIQANSSLKLVNSNADVTFEGNIGVAVD